MINCHGALFVTITLADAAISAFADLENVQVGGSIRIRGNWYSGSSGPDNNTTLRYPATAGRFEVDSPFGWNSDANTLSWVEQRTKLNAKADFTDNVTAFIELDSYDVWGENFRSNYLTGVDSRSSSGVTSTFFGNDGDVKVYQAYVEAHEMLGVPLRLRIGRQELHFGSGWLVAPNETAALTQLPQLNL